MFENYKLDPGKFLWRLLMLSVLQSYFRLKAFTILGHIFPLACKGFYRVQSTLDQKYLAILLRTSPLVSSAIRMMQLILKQKSLLRLWQISLFVLEPHFVSIMSDVTSVLHDPSQ